MQCFAVFLGPPNRQAVEVLGFLGYWHFWVLPVQLVGVTGEWKNLGTNMSPPVGMFEDDVVFPEVGYISLLEAILHDDCYILILAQN